MSGETGKANKMKSASYYDFAKRSPISAESIERCFALRIHFVGKVIQLRPPDDDWRAEVQNLQQIALNIYLIDVRESHKLRANACARYQDRLGSSGTVSIANLEQ